MTQPDAAAPRLAATVLLLRDGTAGFEVLMMTRPEAASFAAGALVFPGGRWDEADRDPAILRHCRPVEGIDENAMALRVTAIRETYEEVNILLARPRGGDALLSGPSLEALKEQVAQPPTFAALVSSGSIELATDMLVPFAHFVTPAIEAKRYDALFFLAPAPADQDAVHDGAEAVNSRWISPAAAIAAAYEDRAVLMLPTFLNLQKLAQSRTVAAALDSARTSRVVTVRPEVRETADGLRLSIPPDAGYGVVDIPIPSRFAPRLP